MYTQYHSTHANSNWS